MIDSNVLIWWVAEPSKLTSRAYSILAEPENEILVSEASIWELANKIHKGKLTSVGDSIRSLLNEIEAQNMTLLPIRLSDILRTETLAAHHRDPFDRMLVAQAMEESVPLIASDSEIAKYELEVIWR